MAVSKRVPADSSNDVRKSADPPSLPTTVPAAERTLDEHEPLGGSETAIPGWNQHLLRAGAALLAGFEILFFVADYFLSPSPAPAATAPHAAAIGLTLCVFALTFSRWFERHWRLVCLANLVALYALTLKLRLLTGDIGPLALTLTITLIGSGALLEWSALWQAGLSAIALATAVMPQLMHGQFDRLSAYRYFGVALGIALGHFILATRERYRAELAQWMDRVRTNNRELAHALGENAAIMVERERAQEKLHENEATLRVIFDALPDSMAITRVADGATLEVNREFLKTGYTREEVLGVSTLELGRWSRPQLRALMHELRARGSVRNFEAELRNKDGRMVPTLVSATMVEIGGKQCAISIAHDVSILKRAERELSAALEALAVKLREQELNRRQLAASEDKLHKVLEAAGEAITVSRLKDGRYLDANQAFCDVTGYTREEVLGHDPMELGLWHDAEQLQRLSRLVKTRGRVRDLECTFRVKDGRLTDHLVSASLANLEGETCIVWATRDVSEIKRTERELRAAREALSAELRELEASQARLRDVIAERETAQRQLRQSEENLRRIFDAGLDAITVKRLRDGRYVEVNNAFEVFGYTREEAREKTAEELGIWADPRQLAAFTEKIRQAGRVSNFETLCQTRDGRIIPSLVSAVTVQLGGEPCVVSFVRDISSLKETERELIAAREAALAASTAKSQFLSMMSHEIRTPMTAIFGMADLLWETPLTSEQRLYLETMRNNSSSLLNLIDGILDLSKVASGRLSLELTDFDLVGLAEGAMETMAPLAYDKGLELALHIPCALSTAVIGDPLRLRQILINLLGNAIKFTERGEVTLTIEAADDTQPATEGAAAVSGSAAAVKRQGLRFVVRDTGIGIAADRQEVIFSDFTQADSRISRKYGGSGLGLAIVKSLVELMNGSVVVESRPGAGSAFSFTIALALQPGTAAKASVISESVARLAGRRLLLVDGSSANRAILAELLAQTGAEVEVAADGGSALAQVERARGAGRPYDAIVADYRVLEASEAGPLRDLVDAPLVPGETLVLMLTAHKLNKQLERLRERGLERGPRCRYLLKPVRRAQLWATVAAACGVTAGDGAHRNGAATPAAQSASCDPLIQETPPPRAAAVIDRPLRILLAEDSADNRLVVQGYLKGTPYLLDQLRTAKSRCRSSQPAITTLS